MYGDFSRVTYDPVKNYSSVLYQQGRVRLDAEDNELQAILLGTVRTVLADLFGEGATADDGFAISYLPASGGNAAALTIGTGSYYVDGIRVLNRSQDSSVSYWQQPYLLLDHDANPTLPSSPFLVYLRVWERTVTPAQDPALREVALGDLAPETAVRSQVIWQVLTTAPPANNTAMADSSWRPAPASPALLMAQAKQPTPADPTPCVISPEAEYRGPENQLYRVEVHTSGQPGVATYKWSRDNASVTFPVVTLDKAVATVTSLGRDGKTALEVGDRVEVVDDRTDFRPPGTQPQKLFQVTAVDTLEETVTLDSAPESTSAALHPILRRWDSPPATPDENTGTVPGDGALPIIEDTWLTLEDGVQVYFSRQGADKDADDGDYESGDYWLIPARVATGDVEWPRSVTGQPIPQPPSGIVYHYARLADIDPTGANPPTDLRGRLTPLTTPFTQALAGRTPAPGTAVPGEPTLGHGTSPAGQPASNQWPADQSTASRPVPGQTAQGEPAAAPSTGSRQAASSAPVRPVVNPTISNRTEITTPVVFAGEPPVAA